MGSVWGASDEGRATSGFCSTYKGEAGENAGQAEKRAQAPAQFHRGHSPIQNAEPDQARDREGRQPGQEASCKRH